MAHERHLFILAADIGFEPMKWRIQSPLPYRLANPQVSNSYYILENSLVKFQAKFTLK